MRRLAAEPRPDWTSKLRQAGLVWRGGEPPSWNECAFYELSPREKETLASAARELHAMSRTAVQHIIDNHLYPQLEIPDHAVPLIERSWAAGAPSIYGRLDLAWDGIHPPKLLEYNADTPASLLEAAVLQRQWLQNVHPSGVQFNSIHEALVTRWQQTAGSFPARRVDFCSLNDAVDRMTITYLEETARQAGLNAADFPIQEIGWNGHTFVGPDGGALGGVFKLYPWEWMVREQFGRYLAAAETVWVEPPWKMLLSNQGLLPLLWKLFPRHPNLLESSFDSPGLLMSWIRKPLLAREGASVTLHQAGRDITTTDDSGSAGIVYQDLPPVRAFDGAYPIIGCWIIGNEPAGIGIRESDLPMVTGGGRFVPHRIG